MTTLYSVQSGAKVGSADVNQFKLMLEGAAGYTDAFFLQSATGTNFIINLGDAAGANSLLVRNSSGTTVWSVNSNGTTTAGGVIFPTSASPAQTTLGSAVYDSNLLALTVGNGAAPKYVGLVRGAGTAATSTKELAYDTTNKLLSVWDGTVSDTVTPIVAYTTTAIAGNTFTTNTTLANIASTTGGVVISSTSYLGFTIAANEIWKATFLLPVTYGGTGGLKLQLAGPATPTYVFAQAWAMLLAETSGDPVYTALYTPITAATAFGSNIVANNSTSNTAKNIVGGTVRVECLIVNGSTAGTVVLQGAQNSSNSTTVFGAGCYMLATRIGLAK